MPEEARKKHSNYAVSDTTKLYYIQEIAFLFEELYFHHCSRLWRRCSMQEIFRRFLKVSTLRRILSSTECIYIAQRAVRNVRLIFSMHAIRIMTVSLPLNEVLIPFSFNLSLVFVRVHQD